MSDTELTRPCTCHPDDNPPVPCAKQYALQHCREFAMNKAATDSHGKPPKFYSGDRVLVGANNMRATVIRQILHYDMNETFWGNLELLYDDGVKGTSHCWQVKRIEE